MEGSDEVCLHKFALKCSSVPVQSPWLETSLEWCLWDGVEIADDLNLGLSHTGEVQVRFLSVSVAQVFSVWCNLYIILVGC